MIPFKIGISDHAEHEEIEHDMHDQVQPTDNIIISL